MKGGKREGSGRKRLDQTKKKVSFSLSNESIDYLEKQKNKSRTIDEALLIHKINASA